MNHSAFTDAVSKRISARALELGISQADVVRATGAAKSTVNAWFNGGAIPRGEHLNGIRKILRCTQDWLFEGRGSPAILNDDKFFGALAASWEVVTGEKPATELVKVPALTLEGAVDSGDLKVFHCANLSGVSRFAAAAWFEASSASAGPVVRPADLVIVDTDVRSFTKSGSYYLIAVAGGINVHRVFTEFDGSVSIEDSERGTRTSVKSEQIDAIRVYGLAVYRSGNI